MGCLYCRCKGANTGYQLVVLNNWEKFVSSGGWSRDGICSVMFVEDTSGWFADQAIRARTSFGT